MLRYANKLLLIAFCLAALVEICGAGAATERGAVVPAISTREAQRYLLELVNRERRQYALSGLAPSRLASRLAREHAAEMAAYGCVGHYDLAGRKPELRFNLLGGTDHVAENIAYYEVGARRFLTRDVIDSMFADLLASPRHRANILHPGHTHMGSNVAWRQSENVTRFYIVQEFVNDWGEYESLPFSTTPNRTLTLRGHLHPAARLAYIGLAFEPPPGARHPREIGEADLHYRQPVPERYLVPGTDFQVDNAGVFNMEVELDGRDVPVDVYITVWVVATGIEQPYRAMTQVVRVE